jgi:hypothetical protein
MVHGVGVDLQEGCSSKKNMQKNANNQSVKSTRFFSKDYPNKSPSIPLPRVPILRWRKKWDRRPAWERLEQWLWPDGVECPYCQVKTAEPPRKSATLHRYKCNNPDCTDRYFNARSNTFLESTKLLPDEAMFAIQVIAAGGSTCNLLDGLGCTRSTARLLRKRIELARRRGLWEYELCAETGSRRWRIHPFPKNDRLALSRFDKEVHTPQFSAG